MTVTNDAIGDKRVTSDCWCYGICSFCHETSFIWSL